jgi:hypothetical protein
MNPKSQTTRASLRLPAVLLVAGQLLYIAATLLHVGGNANDHEAIFAIYARDQIWTVVHLGQFAAIAIMLVGLLGVFSALVEAGRTSWLTRVGSAAAIAALALYGALQAIDGVALKQAVNALAGAPEAERTARLASAEAVRWLEWGMRSYHDFALGLALLVAAVAVGRLFAWPLAGVIALSSVAYLAQGWLAGSEGFSDSQSAAIVIGWALNLVWMTWLFVVSLRADTAAANLKA